MDDILNRIAELEVQIAALPVGSIMRTPLYEITSTGGIEQRFRSN